MNLTIVKTGMKRMGLIVYKHMPQILFGAGVLTGAGALIETARGTTKIDDIFSRKETRLAKIDALMINDTYTEDDRQKDILKTKAIMCVDLAKAYAPATILYAASVTCFLGGHHILAQRYAATAAALTATTKAFNGYRGNVKDELGDEADWRFLHGIKAEELDKVTITDEKGETKEITVVKRSDIGKNPNDYSMYAKVFKKGNDYWQGESSYNMWFLKKVQNQMNDKLLARRNHEHGGYLFLNEVYEALGFSSTKAGAVVGWYIPKEGAEDDNNGDYYVDFGIFSKNGSVRFINDEEDSIILDFNVRGSIYDLLEE
jgi:hypothetical protein